MYLKLFSIIGIKKLKKAVPVEVVGVPASSGNEDPCQAPIKDEPKHTPKSRGSIMATIKTCEGLCIPKKGIDYQGLKILVEKLEGL